VSLLNILKNNSHLLKNISVERIKQELDKIILLKNNIQALEDLEKIDFFKHIIPEINISKLGILKFCRGIPCGYPDNYRLILYYTILFQNTTDTLNKLKFTNTQKKEITWLINNKNKLLLIQEFSKLEARKLMINPLFEKLLIL
jgi:tRNA nucleotidyltransferase/poly(A) polymerase